MNYQYDTKHPQDSTSHLAQSIIWELGEMKFGPYKDPIPAKEQLQAVRKSKEEHLSVIEKIRSYITTNTDLTQKANAKNASAMFSAKSGSLHGILGKYLDAVVESQKTIDDFLKEQREAERLETSTSIEITNDKVKGINTALKSMKEEEQSEEERRALEGLQRGLNDAQEINANLLKLAREQDKLMDGIEI